MLDCDSAMFVQDTFIIGRIDQKITFAGGGIPLANLKGGHPDIGTAPSELLQFRLISGLLGPGASDETRATNESTKDLDDGFHTESMSQNS